MPTAEEIQETQKILPEDLDIDIVLRGEDRDRRNSVHYYIENNILKNLNDLERMYNFLRDNYNEYSDLKKATFYAFEVFKDYLKENPPTGKSYYKQLQEQNRIDKQGLHTGVRRMLGLSTGGRKLSTKKKKSIKKKKSTKKKKSIKKKKSTKKRR